MNWFAFLIVAVGVFLLVVGAQGTYAQVYTFLLNQPFPINTAQAAPTSTTSSTSTGGQPPLTPLHATQVLPNLPSNHGSTPTQFRA
jgi:hypothetical protein